MLRPDMTTEHSGMGDVHRSLELLWRGRGETVHGPRPALTLDAVVDAGIALADREGLAALSMRRVATELGAGTMTLYRYVPGKAELLDLMLDRVALPPEGTPEVLARAANLGWRATLERYARLSWASFVAHPWLVQVDQSRPLLGPNTLTIMEFAVSGLDGLGLTGRERIRMVLAVAHVVDGVARTFLLQQEAVARTGTTDEEFWAAQGPVLEEVMGTGRFPHLAGLGEDAWNMDGEESLESALAVVLDGLERFVADRAG